MSFIRGIWGGHDYIPRVWNEWLRDRRGKMFVVEVDGVPVGMSRVRFLDDGSAWFEGARVHPAYRRRGLASMLGENSVEFARERGVSLFRLTSGSRNRAAHRQIGTIGFKEVSRFSLYEPPRGRRSRRSSKARRVNTTELPVVMRLIERSREFRLGSGVFWHNFSATSLTPELVRELVAEGAIWRSGEAVAVAREGGEGSEIWEEVCFVGGPAVDSMELVNSLMGRRKGAAERWVFVPQGSPVVPALRKEGYRRDFSMVLFERRAARD
jgi:GNAT superfamily N-acetyltransferase